MKLTYEEPLAQIIRLSDEDVLRTSDEDEEVWTPFV